MLSSPAASVYCGEMVKGDEALWIDDALQSPSTRSPLVWTDPACPIDELMASEADYFPEPEYLERLRDQPLDCAARQDAINWILKVHGFYGFRPATAYLAVNYLDRFLSCNELPQGSSSQWPWQLLSVACLSVAAKMEETQVPLLLDLQVMDPRFVFEPITVQRMELLLMAALRWRMRSVTPFDILDRLDSAGRRRGGGNSFAGVLSRASALALGTLRAVDFVSYRPSEIAAAAVVRAAGENPGLGQEDEADGALSCLFDMVGKESVEGCCMLMDEYLTRTCLSDTLDKQVMSGITENQAGAPPPRSPVGVLEAAAACGSCDTEPLAPAEPQPLILGRGTEGPSPKRRKLVGDLQCTESIDDDTVDCGADL